MAELKALCMSCRDENKKPTMQDMTNPTVEEKNNRYSAKGTCGKCGGNMFKFLSKDDAEKLQA
jgi:bacterioferritin-associated ferredoxin